MTGVRISPERAGVPVTAVGLPRRERSRWRCRPVCPFTPAAGLSLRRKAFVGSGDESASKCCCRWWCCSGGTVVVVVVVVSVGVGACRMSLGKNIVYTPAIYERETPRAKNPKRELVLPAGVVAYRFWCFFAFRWNQCWAFICGERKRLQGVDGVRRVRGGGAVASSRVEFFRLSNCVLLNDLSVTLGRAVRCTRWLVYEACDRSGCLSRRVATLGFPLIGARCCDPSVMACCLMIAGGVCCVNPWVKLYSFFCLLWILRSPHDHNRCVLSPAPRKFRWRLRPDEHPLPQAMRGL